ncbi:hypothetical protein HK096_002230 [Nowakowskiella sp. JEL0078]|nr:hypothetical protein HK096_002230 [Nowakowskiella sp. JEL0078]
MPVTISSDFLSKEMFLTLSNVAIAFISLALAVPTVRAVAAVCGLLPSALLLESPQNLLLRLIFNPLSVPLNFYRHKLLLAVVCLLLALVQFAPIVVPLLIHDISVHLDFSNLVQRDVLWKQIDTVDRLHTWSNRSLQDINNCYVTKWPIFSSDSTLLYEYNFIKKTREPVCFAANIQGISDRFTSFRSNISIYLEPINFGSEIVTNLSTYRLDPFFTKFTKGLKCHGVADTFVSICSLIVASDAGISGSCFGTYISSRPMRVNNAENVTWAPGVSGVVLGYKNAYYINDMATQIYINSTLSFDSLRPGLLSIVSNYTILNSSCILTGDLFLNNVTNSSLTLRYTAMSTLQCGNMTGYIDTYWIPKKSLQCNTCFKDPTGWVIQVTGFLIGKLNGIRIINSDTQVKYADDASFENYEGLYQVEHDPANYFSIRGLKNEVGDPGYFADNLHSFKLGTVALPIIENGFVGRACAGPVAPELAPGRCEVETNVELFLDDFDITYVFYGILAAFAIAVLSNLIVFAWLHGPAWRLLGNPVDYMTFCLSELELEVVEKNSRNLKPLGVLHAAVIKREDDVATYKVATICRSNSGYNQIYHEKQETQVENQYILMSSSEMKKIKFSSIVE